MRRLAATLVALTMLAVPSVAGANLAGTDGTPVGTTAADTIRCWTVQLEGWRPGGGDPALSRQRADGRWEVAVGTDIGSEPACVEVLPGVWVNPLERAAVVAYLKARALEASGQVEIAGEPVPFALDLHDWQRMAGCESGGRWHIRDASGRFGGGLQIAAPDVETWSVAEQIAAARSILDRQGPGAWPTCRWVIGWR